MDQIVKLRGYKDQIHECGIGWFAADTSGRGGVVIWMSYDEQLREWIMGAMPSSGPSYELRESNISFTAPPDKE